MPALALETPDNTDADPATAQANQAAASRRFAASGQTMPLTLPGGGTGALTLDGTEQTGSTLGQAPGGSAMTPPPGGGAGQLPLSSEYPSAASTTGTPQNRLQLATNAFDTFARSSEPAYAADLRQATQAAAGKGQIGSGGLRTTYGNLANQRSLALDTQRDSLINAATTGTIADQQAADANRIAQQNADTSRIGTTGNLETARGTLALAQGEATGTVNGQQTVAARQADQDAAIRTAGLTGILNGTETLQAKQDAINAAIAQGHLTNEQGQLALSQLAQSQSNTQATGRLALDTTTAAQSNANAAGRLALDTTGQQNQAQQAAAALALNTRAEGASEGQAAGRLALDTTTAANANANATGRLALDTTGQQNQAQQAAASLQLSRDQLTQAGQQFGLSQAQQLQLATLADRTQNRQLDISGAQGQNTLLLELARIMGDKANTAPPEFLATIARALGIADPNNRTTTTTPTATTTTTNTTGGGAPPGNGDVPVTI